MEHVNALKFDQKIAPIQELTKQDSELQALKVMILVGWLDTKDEIPLCIREYWSDRDKLTVHNGAIFRGNHVIISKALQPEILIRIHASHLRAEACLCKARDVIYWPTINSEEKYFICNCTTCNDYLQNNSKELLINHPNPSKPWSQIAMDIMTVFDRNYLITVDTLELHTLANNPTAASAIQCSRPILEK